VEERFKKTWRGWIESSEGYAIRMKGRTGLSYRDADGELRIDAEAMSSPWNEIIVRAGSIPDTPARRRAQVLQHLHRAFEFAGWRLSLEEG
jgi:hypothetical protein